MAGGAGTRLWPLSRRRHAQAAAPGRPRQEPASTAATSACAACCRRSASSSAPARRTATRCWRTCPSFRRRTCSASPTGRDTANAVGFPAAVLHKRDKDAVIAVVTADHVIEPVDKFQAAVKTAFDVVAAAAQGAGHLRHRPDVRPHGPRLHPPRRAARSKASSGAYRVLRRSRKSPTSRRPTATSSPAATTGTAACSSGGATRC